MWKASISGSHDQLLTIKHICVSRRHGGHAPFHFWRRCISDSRGWTSWAVAGLGHRGNSTFTPFPNFSATAGETRGHAGGPRSSSSVTGCSPGGPRPALHALSAWWCSRRESYSAARGMGAVRRDQNCAACSSSSCTHRKITWSETGDTSSPRSEKLQGGFIKNIIPGIFISFLRQDFIEDVKVKEEIPAGANDGSCLTS